MEETIPWEALDLLDFLAVNFKESTVSNYDLDILQSEELLSLRTVVPRWSAMGQATPDPKSDEVVFTTAVVRSLSQPIHNFL